jgi:DNA-binding CsgD family transcriptional regulator
MMKIGPLNRLDLRHGGYCFPDLHRPCLADVDLSIEPPCLRHGWKNMSSDFSALPDALLLDLYASAAEPARWPHALDQLCLQTGARSAAAVAFSFDHGRTRIHWTALDSRLGRIKLPAKADLPTNSHPRLDSRRALRALNRIVGDEVLFDSGDAALPRLRQQMAAVGCGRFLGTVQEVSRGMFLGLGLNRAIDDRLDFSAAQVGSMAAVTPHLGQAFSLTDRLQTSLIYDRHLCRQLDQLRCGMVFCDAEGRVDWFNRSAARLLAAGPLRLIGSRLIGDTEADTTKLLNELAKAGAAGNNAVRYLRLGWDDWALHVAIQASAQSSTLVLTLTSPSRGADLPIDALVQLFGLTHTEAGLVAALATGSTLEEYAQQRGVTVGTTRVQLRRVQVKTATRRQSDLVRLVWSSAAAHLSSGFADPAEPPIRLGAT